MIDQVLQEIESYDDYPEIAWDKIGPPYADLIDIIEEQKAHIYELEQMLGSIRGLGGLADEGTDEVI